MSTVLHDGPYYELRRVGVAEHRTVLEVTNKHDGVVTQFSDPLQMLDLALAITAWATRELTERHDRAMIAFAQEEAEG